MAEAIKKARPVCRNIGSSDTARYRLSWAGKMSILYHASSALILLLLPFVLYLLKQSLTPEVSFVEFTALLSNGFTKVVVLALIQAYLRYFCAGTRYLVLDLHIGIDKTSAPKSTVSALITNLLLTIMFGAKLLSLF